MKKFIYTIAAASMMFTSCMKDDNVPEAPVDPPVTSGVVLNEIMSNNVGDGVDWIEIYNSGTEAMDISGYMLNDAETTAGGWAIPDGTSVEAGGFVVFDENEWDFGGVGSSGEWVSFADASGNLVDKEEVPDMKANAGLTWARETDGAETWVVASPTKGESNGDVENTAPILDASELTEFDDVYAVTASDADGIASVKLVLMVNEGVVSIDMALVDGKYRTSVPKAAVGSIVKYYVIAADNTGLTTVYPEGGIETPGEYTVVGGFDGDPSFSEVQDATTLLYNFTVSGIVYYPEQVDEIRVYYVLNDVVHDETVDPPLDTKDKVKVPAIEIADDGTFNAVIEGLSKDDKITYYIRVEYLQGTKTYYPNEETDVDGNVTSDFNHDKSSTWPNVMVGSIPVAPINGFSELSVTNEVGSDLVFDVKFENDNGASAVKFYYYVNFDQAAYDLDPTGYEDANRLDISWAGDLPTTDNMYNFTIPGLIASDNISWYIRGRDASADENKFYFTFGQGENFDKGVIADWHVVIKN